MISNLLSIFTKGKIILSQSNNHLTFENSTIKRIRQLIVFILLLFSALDLVYVFTGTWSTAATFALSTPTLALLFFSNIKGKIRIQKNRIESQYQCFLFNKSKKTSLHLFPHMVIEEVLGSSVSHEKNPIPFFIIYFTKQTKTIDKKEDICLNDIHLYERDLTKIAEVLTALESVVQRRPTFYKHNDIAIDTEINKLEKHYQALTRT